MERFATKRGILLIFMVLAAVLTVYNVMIAPPLLTPVQMLEPAQYTIRPEPAESEFFIWNAPSWQHILLSAEQDKINLNTATAEELMQVKGIGPALAENILAYREQIGLFGSTDQLINVSGIGEARLAQFAPQFRVE